MPHLGAEEAVQQGGHERGRLLLGDPDGAHEILCSLQSPCCGIPAAHSDEILAQTLTVSMTGGLATCCAVRIPSTPVPLNDA